MGYLKDNRGSLHQWRAASLASHTAAKYANWLWHSSVPYSHSQAMSVQFSQFPEAYPGTDSPHGYSNCCPSKISISKLLLLIYQHSDCSNQVHSPSYYFSFPWHWFLGNGTSDFDCFLLISGDWTWSLCSGSIRNKLILDSPLLWDSPLSLFRAQIPVDLQHKHRPKLQDGKVNMYCA